MNILGGLGRLGGLPPEPNVNNFASGCWWTFHENQWPHHVAHHVVSCCGDDDTLPQQCKSAVPETTWGSNIKGCRFMPPCLVVPPMLVWLCDDHETL